MIRLAILTTDNREHHRRYDLPEPYFGTAVEALLQGLSEIPDLEVHVISCAQRPMSAPQKLSANTWFHLLHVPKFGWLRTGYQGCVRAVRAKLRQIEPDLVHGQGTEREAALCAALSGFPNVVTLHGIMSRMAAQLKPRPGTYLWCAAKLEQFTLRRTSGVFCNSSYTESVVQRNARQTWHVPNAVRREFFEIPAASDFRDAKPILLNIGSVSPHKRQIELLESIEQLHRDGHIFELQFIGPASARDKYGAAFLDRIKAAQRAGFGRYVETKSLPDLIASLDAASALIHVPSEESFGLVVAEALSRNLKFFGTNIGGISDIALDIEGVELFSLTDSTGLKTAISRWLRDQCPRPKTAATATRSRYHPKLIAEQHREIYGEILAKRNK